ncbi:hypothetical protein BDM02DRAFT_1442430 [Thelephora ganbajun]|uniref:Uncharacterized protein n=1 Tax=Thelephora ganbajun TaxID=370292 RepID=A0ACB6Z1U6_THEGA|nr:hypothetical protein BDM02DRAFT_1442430 [Thelephora ganbajun]
MRDAAWMTNQARNTASIPQPFRRLQKNTAEAVLCLSAITLRQHLFMPGQLFLLSLFSRFFLDFFLFFFFWLRFRSPFLLSHGELDEPGTDQLRGRLCPSATKNPWSSAVDKTRSVCFDLRSLNDKYPILTPHTLPSALPRPVLFSAFHECLTTDSMYLPFGFRLPITGINKLLCIRLRVPALASNYPTRLRSESTRSTIFSLILSSPGHPPLLIGRRISKGASPPHFVHIVPQPHSWAFRCAIKRSSAIFRARSVPGLSSELLIAVSTNLSHTCNACRCPARSRFAPRPFHPSPDTFTTPLSTLGAMEHWVDSHTPTSSAPSFMYLLASPFHVHPPLSAAS